jgi:NADH dehydrogenase
MDQIAMLVEENICDGTWQGDFRFEPSRFGEGIAKYLKP